MATVSMSGSRAGDASTVIVSERAPGAAASRKDRQSACPGDGAGGATMASRRSGRGATSEEIDALIRGVFAQPRGAQLGILRTVAPRILSGCSDDERQSFLRDLQAEIEHLSRGGAPYDVRSTEPSHVH